jgi:hypothetical protein
MTWEPQPPDGVTTQRSSNLSIISSTVLVDFASVAVKAGRRYMIEAQLVWAADASGGINVNWASTATTDSLEQIAGEMYSLAPSKALVDVLPQVVPMAYDLEAVGPTVGLAHLKGIITFTSDGAVSIQASQHASNGAATTVYKESWFRVTEV